MSGLRPSNWVLLFEIPLDNTFRVSADAKFTTKADVADMIAADRDKRLIMIAGPSSSGKTTFSHRLSIQKKMVRQS